MSAESFDLRRALTLLGMSDIPIVPVTLSNGRHSARVEALLDSGADLSMIPLSLGRHLRLQRRSSPVRFLEGVAGRLRYRLCTLELSVGRLPLQARFAWAESDDAPILLGRADVFPALKILFDGHARRLHLSG